MSSSSATTARADAWTPAAVRAIPVWAWLAALVVVSALVRYAFARRMPAPWIMADELIYSELAKSFAERGEFLLRDVTAGGAYGVVYPLLISPAYLLFESVPDAYAVAKGINAITISLAAIPVYALARRVLEPPLALAAAALALAVPSTLYAGTLMTENVFYPLFLAAALTLVLAVERPTLGRSVVFLAVTAVAFLARVQAAVLVPAAITAPAIVVLARGGGVRALGAYRWLYAGVGGAVALAVAAELVRGRSPKALFGAYRVAADAGYDVGEVARWLLYHAAELDLYLGVLPFAAFLLLLATMRRLRGAEQTFLAVAASLSLWLLLAAAAFASEHTFPPRVEERNVFYLAPFFVVALLVLVERGLPRPPVAATAAALTAALAPALLPFEDLVGVQAQSDTLAMLVLWSVHTAFVPLESMWAFVAVCGLAAAALFLFLPRRLALVLPAAVLAYFLVVLEPIEASEHGVRQASVGALFQGITAPRRDWIDAAVGPEADVAVVWTGLTHAFTVWENEFFNRSVRSVHHLRGPVPDGLPQTRVAVDPVDGVFRDSGGRPVRADYVLTDDSVFPAGREVARDDAKGVAVFRVTGAARTTTLIRGLYEDGWSGPTLTYRRFQCPGGAVTVRVESDPNLFRSAQTVVARAHGRTVARARVPPRGRRLLTVPLRPNGLGSCTVSFAVTPIAVPAEQQAGSDDTRRLGARFSRFRYRA